MYHIMLMAPKDSNSKYQKGKWIEYELLYVPWCSYICYFYSYSFFCSSTTYLIE